MEMSSNEKNLRRLLLTDIREHAVDVQLHQVTRESAVAPRVRSPDDSDRESDSDMFKRLQLRRALKKNRDGEAEMPPRRPMFATVCINNVNRSMEAHCVLRDAGLRVCSFGAGVQVCFPGRKIDTPRLFGFATEYKTMYNTLRAEDEELYRIIGVLKMLERNMQVKPKPQQFQLLLNKQLLDLDVVVCLDYSMFIQVLNDLRMRIRLSFHKKRLHVICLDVEDTPQDALNGGALTLELCQEIDALPELNDVNVKEIVVAFEKRHQLELFYVGLSV